MCIKDLNIVKKVLNCVNYLPHFLLNVDKSIVKNVEELLKEIKNHKVDYEVDDYNDNCVTFSIYID